MTENEFRDWSKRLFVAFPGFWAWVNDNSPEPKATLAQWCKTLKPYTLVECDAVLDAWTSGRTPPPAAYEREKVALVVRSIIELQRSRERNRREVAEGRASFDRLRNRNNYEPLPNSPWSDQDMAATMQLGRVEHQKLKRGEIDKLEYHKRLNKLLAAMTKPGTTDGQPVKRPPLKDPAKIRREAIAQGEKNQKLLGLKSL
jgi:hypothetical protein